MNTFLVISGVVIVGLLVTLWLLKKFNIQKAVFGIPLKYIIDIVLVLVAIIVVIVVKAAFVKKNKALEALLLKLRIRQAQNNINIIDDHISQTDTCITGINEQIRRLEGQSDKTKIDALIQQKKEIENQLIALKNEKQGHQVDQESLQKQIDDMEKILG